MNQPIKRNDLPNSALFNSSITGKQIAIMDLFAPLNIIWCDVVQVRFGRSPLVVFDVINGRWRGSINERGTVCNAHGTQFQGKIVWTGQAPFARTNYADALKWIHIQTNRGDYGPPNHESAIIHADLGGDDVWHSSNSQSELPLAQDGERPGTGSGSGCETIAQGPPESEEPPTWFRWSLYLAIALGFVALCVFGAVVLLTPWWINP